MNILSLRDYARKPRYHYIVKLTRLSVQYHFYGLNINIIIFTAILFLQNQREILNEFHFFSFAFGIMLKANHLGCYFHDLLWCVFEQYPHWISKVYFYVAKGLRFTLED